MTDAEKWNKLCPVGTAVRYWPVLPAVPGIKPITTTTRSEAWTLGDGTVVVQIVGGAGGVHLAHLEVLDEDIRVSLRAMTDVGGLEARVREMEARLEAADRLAEAAQAELDTFGGVSTDWDEEGRRLAAALENYRAKAR